MRVDFDWLPLATPLDPAEEPPGSIDPLGTLAHAERLADALLPGFTARMWRGRLLTFATIAAAVADRTVALMDDREDLRLEARLGFERLFVSAVVHMVEREPETYGDAPRRLPGRDLAKNALLEGEPLTRANFLKGQAVNGPFGVIARLARHMELIDDDSRMGRKAAEVLMAWSDDEHLPGVLYEEGDLELDGARWIADAVKQTAARVTGRKWPGRMHRIWELLASRMRPDQIGPKESHTLLELLHADPVRRRALELMKNNADVYAEIRKTTAERGEQERVVLLRGVKPQLGDDATDRHIAALIEAIDAYERTSGIFQQSFEEFVRALKAHGGRERRETLLAEAELNQHLQSMLRELNAHLPRIDSAVENLSNQPLVDQNALIEPIVLLREDIVAAKTSIIALADTILSRHERVQKDKAKAPWIERDSYWTLMPGENRVTAEAPPVWQHTYLHPFKIQNAYSILGDLGQVTVEARHGEE